MLDSMHILNAFVQEWPSLHRIYSGRHLDWILTDVCYIIPRRFALCVPWLLERGLSPRLLQSKSFV